jgi:purine nucleoside permease
MGGSFTRLAVGLLTVALFQSIGLAPARANPVDVKPIEVRVVVVTTWEAMNGEKDLYGELHAWRTQWPMRTELPFPAGVRPLLYDPQRHVLAILTGMATARASASIMALGLDPRFDLSHAYWLLAGTAGADPKVASLGSVAIERYVVDGDLGQELDARDMPPDWPTGIFPNGRAAPFVEPAPKPFTDDGDTAFALNRGLADWAFGLTRTIKLADPPRLAKARAPYSGPGAAPPSVIEGDGLMSARFWYGAHMTAWAERWVPYWTHGEGVFAMSAEEDTGVMQALTQLARAGRVRTDRVLMLRAASDFVAPPPGMPTADFVSLELRHGLPAEQEALGNLYVVGAPIVRALADDWAKTRTAAPAAH